MSSIFFSLNWCTGNQLPAWCLMAGILTPITLLVAVFQQKLAARIPAIQPLPDLVVPTGQSFKIVIGVALTLMLLMALAVWASHLGLFGS